MPSLPVKLGKFILNYFSRVKGYGPLLGAIGGNTLSDTVAALPEGKYAAAGAFTGSSSSSSHSLKVVFFLEYLPLVECF
jgi:hypothetical protein